MAYDFCPILNKKCIEHQCKFYTQLQGYDANSGKEINEENCTFVFIPKLLIENAQVSRQVGAALDSFRNEMVKQNAAMETLLLKAGEKQEIVLITQDDKR